MKLNSIFFCHSAFSHLSDACLSRLFEEELSQIFTSKWLIDWLPQQLGGYRCRNLTSGTFSSLPSTRSLLPLSSLLSAGLIPVSIQCLLRLPNGDESRRCVRDLTMPRHKSGKPVHQHQPRMNWVNGILTLQIVGESVVWGPEIPLWLHALCPETCCSRFIHLYSLQVGSWLPESQQNTVSQCWHTQKYVPGITLVPCALAELSKNTLKSCL